MLLPAIQPTLCPLSLHDWQPDPATEEDAEVQSCARGGATRVPLPPGRKANIAGVQIEFTNEHVCVKES